MTENKEEQTNEELEKEYNSLLKGEIDILRAKKEQREKDEVSAAAAEKQKADKELLNAQIQEGIDATLKQHGFKKPEDTQIPGSDIQIIGGDAAKGKENESNPQANKAGIKLTELFKDTPEIRKNMQGYRDNYLKKHVDRVSGKALKDVDTTPYGYSGFLGESAQANTPYIDLGGEGYAADVITSWSPVDIWCDLIWQAVKCKKALAGVITLQACNINAGDGLSVQIRAINNTHSIGSALNPCECSTHVSTIFTTYTITLKRYDIYKKICNLDLFDVGYVLRDAIVTAISQDFALGLDGLVWGQLQAATPGLVEAASGSFTCNPGIPGNPRFSYSCCSYTANLYKAIINLESRMLSQGYGGNGFYLVLGHRVANYLKYKEGINVPPWMASVIKMDGTKLVGVGERIKVIEYCSAQDCTDSYKFKGTWKTSPSMAYLVDPDRAIGEAYGKRPFLKTDEDPIECDQLKLVLRSYVGISKLSDGAIGVIRNP